MIGILCFFVEVKMVGLEGFDKFIIFRGCSGMFGVVGFKGDIGVIGGRGMCFGMGEGFY